MSTHYVFFHGEIRKILCVYSSSLSGAIKSKTNGIIFKPRQPNLMTVGNNVDQK